jgi:hypothetical protein
LAIIGKVPGPANSTHREKNEEKYKKYGVLPFIPRFFAYTKQSLHQAKLTPSDAYTKRCLHQAKLAPSGTIPKSPIPSFSKSELAQIAYFLSWNSPELLF